MTLAEMLITVGIIGVIAAIILPTTLKSVSSWIFSTSNAVFLSKLKEATNQMALNSPMVGYATNDAFVDEFSKYVKIAKRCTSSNLSECFVSRFTTSTQAINVGTSLMTGADLGQIANTSTLSGLVLLDGTTILMAYSPICDINARVYNTSVPKTSCMSMVYDTNASKGPNKVGKDILTINATLSACDIRISGLCIAAGDTTPSAINTCTDTTWDTNLTANTYCANNYWAGAKKSCSAQGMRLPSITELNTIYTNRATISGLNSAANYWSATEYNTSMAWFQSFATGGQYGTVTSSFKGFGHTARCVRS